MFACCAFVCVFDKTRPAMIDVSATCEPLWKLCTDYKCHELFASPCTMRRRCATQSFQFLLRPMPHSGTKIALNRCKKAYYATSTTHAINNMMQQTNENAEEVPRKAWWCILSLFRLCMPMTIHECCNAPRSSKHFNNRMQQWSQVWSYPGPKTSLLHVI